MPKCVSTLLKLHSSWVLVSKLAASFHLFVKPPLGTASASDF